MCGARKLIAACVVNVLCMGCNSGGSTDEIDIFDTSDTSKTEFQCEIGTLDGNGVFVPHGNAAKAELQLGFQGFLFVALHVRAVSTDVGGSMPESVDALYSTTIGTASPFGGRQPDVSFSAMNDGSAISDEVLVFFNEGTISDYVDVVGDVAMRFENESHRCITTATLTFVDEDPCIHTDAEPI